MQSLEVSCAVRPIYGSLGFKRLRGPRLTQGYSARRMDGDALISQIYFWIKFCMFRTVPLSIIRSFSLHIQQTCTAYTNAVRTVKNS